MLLKPKPPLFGDSQMGEVARRKPGQRGGKLSGGHFFSPRKNRRSPTEKIPIRLDGDFMRFELC